MTPDQMIPWLLGAFGTSITLALGLLVKKLDRLTVSVVELDKTVAVMLARLAALEDERRSN